MSSTRLLRWVCPAVICAVFTCVPPAHAEEVTLGWPMRELQRDGAVAREYAFDAKLALPLLAAEEARLEDVEMPDGRKLDLVVKRVRVTKPTSFVGVDGFRSPEPLDADLTMWSGIVDGAAGGVVFLAFSPYGTRGIIELTDRRYHLIAKPAADGDWSATSSRLEVALPDQDAMSPFQCGQDEVEQPLRMPMLSAPPPAPGSGGSAESPPPTAATGQTIYACDIAVETDYQFSQIFNGNAKALTNYVATLFGAISSLYYNQIGVVLRVAYLGVWTTSNDPWSTPESSTGNTSKMLTEFRTKWDDGAAPVDVPLYHFLSGASLGGGIAYLSAVCNSAYRFGVSANLAGNLTFPVSQGYNTWDFVVAAHEIGHNFGTSHTHDYCPPLDQCAPSGYFGSCQTAQVCQQSTIMSYCHTCAGGMNNIQITFGSTVATTMRNFATSISSCLETVAAPDLEGAACTGPTSGASNGAIALDTRVVNSGTPLSGSFTYQIRLSADSTITTADILLASVTNATPGTIVTTNTTLPAGLSPGGYFFGLTIDAASAETDFADNAFTGNGITITDGSQVPNLQASSITGPSTATAGAMVTVSRYIVNVGSSYTGSFAYSVRLSTDSSITSGDTLVQSVGSSALGALDLDVTIPETIAPGTWVWGLIVDPVAGETVTSDNAVAGGTITIASGPAGTTRFVPGDALIGALSSGVDTDTIYFDLLAGEEFTIQATQLAQGLLVDLGVKEPGDSSFSLLGTLATSSSASFVAAETGRYQLEIAVASGTGNYTFATTPDYSLCTAEWSLKLDSDDGNLQGVSFDAIPGTRFSAQGKASKKIKGKGLVATCFAPDQSAIDLTSVLGVLGKKGFKFSDALLDDVGTFSLYVSGVKGPGKPATLTGALDFPLGTDTVTVD